MLGFVLFHCCSQRRSWRLRIQNTERGSGRKQLRAFRTSEIYSSKSVGVDKICSSMWKLSRHHSLHDQYQYHRGIELGGGKEVPSCGNSSRLSVRSKLEIQIPFTAFPLLTHFLALLRSNGRI